MRGGWCCDLVIYLKDTRFYVGNKLLSQVIGKVKQDESKPQTASMKCQRRGGISDKMIDCQSGQIQTEVMIEMVV